MRITPQQAIDMNYASNPQYPEYYGAKGDGIAYYDWPLACFGGIVDDNITIEGGTSDIEVYAPGERIYYKYGMTVDYFGKSLDYTTSDVLYSSVSKKFVLKANNKYYDKWENSDAWNDPTTRPRTDTVFSDIRELTVTHDSGACHKARLDPDDLYGLTMRDTYIFCDGRLIDINDTMTDDGPALCDWFNANKGAGKVAMLAPGRIYYINSKKTNGKVSNLSSGDNLFVCAEDTTVIGGGAVLFPRMTAMGWPPKRQLPNVAKGGSFHVFHLNGAHRTRIEDIAIMTLRDRDGGCPSGSNYRFSTSSSNSMAFHCGTDTQDVHIADVRCKNVGAPLDFKDGHNFTIERVTATGVINNAFGLKSSVYDDIHIEMAPYIGSGMHAFYGGNSTNQVVVRNSTIKAVDPYTEVLITMHGGSAANNPEKGSTHDVLFENCVIEGGGPIARGDNYSEGLCWLHFEDCRISRLFDKFISASNYYDSNYLFNEKKSSWEFTRCEIDVRQGVLMVKASKPHTLILTDTIVHATKSSSGKSTLYLVGRSKPYDGNLVVENFRTDYTGPLGFDLPDDGSFQGEFTEVDEKPDASGTPTIPVGEPTEGERITALERQMGRYGQAITLLAERVSMIEQRIQAIQGGDINGDGKVNVSDVMAIVNKILNA